MERSQLPHGERIGEAKSGRVGEVGRGAGTQGKE